MDIKKRYFLCYDHSQFVGCIRRTLHSSFSNLSSSIDEQWRLSNVQKHGRLYTDNGVPMLSEVSENRRLFM